jgi:hypothetical protein
MHFDQLKRRHGYWAAQSRGRSPRARSPETARFSRAHKSNQCRASAGKSFLNVASAAELLFYLEFAASALKKSAPRPRKRGDTKIALNYR